VFLSFVFRLQDAVFWNRDRSRPFILKTGIEEEPGSSVGASPSEEKNLIDLILLCEVVVLFLWASDLESRESSSALCFSGFKIRPVMAREPAGGPLGQLPALKSEEFCIGT